MVLRLSLIAFLALGCTSISSWPSDRLFREIRSAHPELASLSVENTKRFRCVSSSDRLLVLHLTPHERTETYFRQWEILCEKRRFSSWRCNAPEEHLFLRGMPNVAVFDGIAPRDAQAAISLVSELVPQKSTLDHETLSADKLGAPVSVSRYEAGTCVHRVTTENGFRLCVPNPLLSRDVSVLGVGVVDTDCYVVDAPAA